MVQDCTLSSPLPRVARMLLAFIFVSVYFSFFRSLAAFWIISYITFQRKANLTPEQNIRKQKRFSQGSTNAVLSAKEQYCLGSAKGTCYE